ncbi:non-receptor serine/threonine protein kinase [Lithospermum erythrorhizon]|uniref:cyclin-dependent kinase n=1 Tax=Lithospermum erythrorhizon TaxID=34254 RepID=A0AAV3NJP3_LITER
MSSGRHRCVDYAKFKDMEMEIKVREIGYKKGFTGDRVRVRNRDCDRGKIRDVGFGDDKGRIRSKEIKEREVMMSCGDEFTKSSDSGSNGGVGVLRRRSSERDADREPGELSSDSGSDRGIVLDLQVKESGIKEIESGDQLPVKGNKRNFSSIIRDRDDKEVSSVVKNSDYKVGSHDGNSVSPRPRKIAKIKVLQPTQCSVELDPYLSAGSSSLIDRTSSGEAREVYNDVKEDIVEDEDFVPSRNIRSSRWAKDFDSPASEGEISEDGEMPKLKRKPSDTVEARGHKKSVTPELGELKREGSLGVRSKSSDSGERVWSSSRDSCSGHVTDTNDMDVDEDHHYDGGSASQSDTELEDSDGTPKLAFSSRRNASMLHGCRNVDEFERLNKINEGTYGVVYRARDKKTGEIVALKKVKMEKEREGFPLTALREINILLSFDHPSIVDVKEVVVGSSLDDIFMVMEYMEHDLKGFLQTREQPFSQSEVKSLMLQLLKGTKYLHDNWVLHRDLKTSNLLLNNNFELKICDFGLARQYGSPSKPYTQLVVTLWYRAPELLLGAKQYSTAIDMWSLGCIMAELLSKGPLFNGKSELDQIDKIFRTLGTPNDTTWPGYSKLPGAKGNFVKHQSNNLRKKFPPSSFTGAPFLSDAGFDLLSKLLTYDPERRISAEAALEHEWFQEDNCSKAKELGNSFFSVYPQDRHMRRITEGPDTLEGRQWRELQQWGSSTGGVFGLSKFGVPVFDHILSI